MKMPTTTNVKVETKESKVSTEMGDAAKQCINCLDKKVRNLEKRKTRIEQNQEKAKKGSKLEKEQEVSLQQYDQVTHDLEFARELQKQFQQIYAEHEKMSKKQAKREKVERQAQEIKRVSEILQLQSLLDLLGGDKVREDFKTGKHGAVLLTEDNLNQLDEIYQEISPSREESGYSQRLLAASEHLVAILDGKDRQVVGTTYKEIKELITQISECGYFEKLTPEAEAEEPETNEDQDNDEESAATESEAVATEASQAEVSEEAEDQPQSEQQPIDLTVEAAEVEQPPQQEVPVQQQLNTVEQDAFFAPSSSTYQVEPEPQFPANSAQPSSNNSSRQVSDFQSFTNNRPFQFIQNSYIMPEVAADPAVIAAQPAGASGLQFMSQSYEPSNTQQQQQAPPSQQQQQSVMHQADGRYQPGPSALPVEEVALGTGLPSHASNTVAAAAIRAPLGEAAAVLSSHSAYEIPPSIPMPPSKLQEQSQLDQQSQQQQEKKFQMNANAEVFQSMYAQQVASGQAMAVPPPSVQSGNVGGHISGEQLGQPQQQQQQQQQPGSLPGTSDFPAVVQGGPPPQPVSAHSNGDYGSQSGGSGDFQPYQGNGFGGGFSRGGRGGYRGGRGGSGGNGNRNGGGMQNGFNNRGGPGNAGRGGRGNYQGYPANSNYRPDGFQGGYNSGNGVGAAGGGFGGQVYSKRGGGGGMGGAGGAGQGGGQGYNRGGGGAGNMPRGGAGGMRGGGMQRGGGQGAPRGMPRGGQQFNRTATAQ